MTHLPPYISCDWRDVCFALQTLCILQNYFTNFNFLYAAALLYASRYTVHFEFVVIICREVVLCENVISL